MLHHSSGAFQQSRSHILTITKKKTAHHVRTHKNFKRIKGPVGQVWSGLELVTKPDQLGLSSSICLEAVMEQS